MRESFEAHVCTVADMEDVNTFLVALADQEAPPHHYLELQRSIEQEEQDVALGMNTYCIVTASGASYYGGLETCILTNDSLILEFSDDAEAELGIKSFDITLALSSSDKSLLRSGLMKLFFEDHYKPKRLIL